MVPGHHEAPGAAEDGRQLRQNPASSTASTENWPELRPENSDLERYNSRSVAVYSGRFGCFD